MPAYQNQTILITGAAGGIGRELCRQFAREGAAIAGLDANESAIRELGETLGHDFPGLAFMPLAADVTQLAQMQEAVQKVAQHFGPVDVLVANAGTGQETRALNLDPLAVQKILEVNLLGVSHSLAAVLPNMVARKKGHLVGISSIASFKGVPGLAAYCASKAGLNALMEAYRIELAPHNIQVTTICPGWIRTPLTKQVRLPNHHFMDAGKAGTLIFRAIQSRRAFYSFPWSQAFPLRALSWLPTWLGDWIIRRQMAQLG